MLENKQTLRAQDKALKLEIEIAMAQARQGPTLTKKEPQTDVKAKETLVLLQFKVSLNIILHYRKYLQHHSILSLLNFIQVVRLW